MENCYQLCVKSVVVVFFTVHISLVWKPLPVCFSYLLFVYCFVLVLFIVAAVFLSVFFLQRVRGLRTGRGWLLYLT